jgi:lysine/ornithine N-monooxygenase
MWRLKRFSCRDETELKKPPKPKSVDVEMDLIGGGRPANLSLASADTARARTDVDHQSSSSATRRCLALSLMFPDLMQTEFYRDLVTPIDPTSKFSFLNYLKARAPRRVLLLIDDYPTRREFEDYFRVADRSAR